MTETHSFTGNDIFRLRKMKGLSRREFAHLVGCGVRQVYRWEEKKEQIIKMSLAFERAILGLTLTHDWLPEYKKERGLA